MVLKLWLMCVINMEVRLKKFLNDNDIEVQSVKYSNILGVDCYLFYTCKNYHINYLRKQLGSMDFYRVPKLQGKDSYVFIIKVEDAHKLLSFNFMDALGEDNYEELIKKQLIINGTGKASTKVRFVEGKLVLLYNTLYSATCIAKSLHICNDAVVDVGADDCGDLKMIVLLDRVNNPWVSKPIPKFCEYDFDLKKDALDTNNPCASIRKQLEKNCIDCGTIDISSNDIIRFNTDAKIDDIAMALNVPIESVVDLCDKKYILLDRVLGKVIYRECD